MSSARRRLQPETGTYPGRQVVRLVLVPAAGRAAPPLRRRRLCSSAALIGCPLLVFAACSGNAIGLVVMFLHQKVGPSILRQRLCGKIPLSRSLLVPAAAA